MASVAELRANSGLTDVQFARLFGVSPRNLHHWMSGGPMTQGHQRRAREITAVIDGLPGTTPEEKRQAILASSASGYSAYDRLRAGNSEHRGFDINPALPVEVLLGGHRLDLD